MIYLEKFLRDLSPPPLLTLGAQLRIPFLGSRKSGWLHWGHIPVLETTLWVPHGAREEEFLKGKLRICYQKKGNWLLIMETPSVCHRYWADFSCLNKDYKLLALLVCIKDVKVCLCLHLAFFSKGFWVSYLCLFLSYSFLKNIYLFIWLHWVLVVVHRVFLASCRIFRLQHPKL